MTYDEVRDAVDADIVASAITRISIAAVLWRASKRTCSGCWRLRRRVCEKKKNYISKRTNVRSQNKSTYKNSTTLSEDWRRIRGQDRKFLRPGRPEEKPDRPHKSSNCRSRRWKKMGRSRLKGMWSRAPPLFEAEHLLLKKTKLSELRKTIRYFYQIANLHAPGLFRSPQSTFSG